jgi:hypothetical protein
MKKLFSFEKISLDRGRQAGIHWLTRKSLFANHPAEDQARGAVKACMMGGTVSAHPLPCHQKAEEDPGHHIRIANDERAGLKTSLQKRASESSACSLHILKADAHV